MREDDVFDIDDKAGFVDDALNAAWERTGKGKKRWEPGDNTGDSLLDTRLLWSSWVLDPLELRLRAGLDGDSLQAALVFGWLKLPFTVVSCGDGTGFARKDAVRIKVEIDVDGALPRLTGKGVPTSPGGAENEGLQSVSEICSFAAGVAKNKVVAPASGRGDLAAWLADEAASVESFAPLLLGRIPGASDAPCLHSWGLSVDDAVVVAALVSRCEANQREPDDEKVKCYIDGCLEEAGLVGLFGLSSVDQA